MRSKKCLPKWRGVRWFFDRTLTGKLYRSTKMAAISSCIKSAATCKRVSLSLSSTQGSAPFCKRHIAKEILPAATENIKGVRPSGSLASRSAPLLKCNIDQP